MKARTLIALGSSVAAIVALPGQPAGAMIPGDGGPSRPHEQMRQVEGKQPQQRTGTTIRAGSYDKQAYVQGGASTKVAKAITAAGRKRPL